MTILVPHGFEANYTLGFAKGLAANGVPLLVLSDEASERRLTAANITNINVRGSDNEDRRPIVKLIGLMRYYLRLLSFLVSQRGNTFHFIGIFRNELILFDGIILNLTLRALSGHYIYTAHNVLPHNRESNGLFRILYRIIYRIPNYIVVHTEKAREVLHEQFGVPLGKIRLMSIGLNEEISLTPSTQRECRVNLGINGDERVILFFGRIDEYKGLHLLLDAFQSLGVSDARLIIAGAFRSSEYERIIRGKIALNSRRDAIILDSRLIPNAEVETYLKAADVLCLPYLNIYQSGVLFLAMTFGLPVVATNVGSMSKYVTPETGLITMTLDAPGLREALEAFFANKGSYNRERIRRIGENYRWDRVCRILVPLYQERDSMDIG